MRHAIRLTTVMSIVTLIICMTLPGHAATSYLPVGHRAYDFLERMEALQFVIDVRLGMKPVTRAHVAGLLEQVADHRRFMSSTDREELDVLLDEFKPDLPSRKGLAWDDRGPNPRLPWRFKDYLYRNRRNFLSTFGDTYTLYLDPVIVRTGTVMDREAGTERILVDSNGFLLRGTVGDRVGFMTDVRDSREYGSLDYPEMKVSTMPGRGYVSFKGDRAEFDETRAHVMYSAGRFALSYGRYRQQWGRGSDGGLALSPYASPYDMAAFETSFWRVRFRFFVAELEQYPPIAEWYYNQPPGVNPDSVAVKKFMTGHRADIDITERLSVGIYETVVYGGRLDASYLNPLMFLTGAEHTNGDHDNACMGIDFRWLVHRGQSLYGELYIDDISMRKLGSDYWGNKLGFQVGTLLVEPFAVRDMDTRLEYTRIRPWVYTTQEPINTYTHYGDVLGHPIGPNADRLFFQVRRRFTRRFHADISLSRYRHGANTADRKVGGDPLEVFLDSYPTDAPFLAGDLETVNTYGAGFSYEVFWQLFMRGAYRYEDRDGGGDHVVTLSIGLNE